MPNINNDPISLLFGGMEKLGPGDNYHTLQVLHYFPIKQFRLIVDVGCSTGRQTLALAKELRTLIHAIDSHEPFLTELRDRAERANVEELVETLCMDMKDVSDVFRNIDLLWSEGAAYSIGFANALATWMTAISPGGFAVISELSWLKETAPPAVEEFFQTGYPDMQSVESNIALMFSMCCKGLSQSNQQQYLSQISQRGRAATNLENNRHIQLSAKPLRASAPRRL